MLERDKEKKQTYVYTICSKLCDNLVESILSYEDKKAAKTVEV